MQLSRHSTSITKSKNLFQYFSLLLYTSDSSLLYIAQELEPSIPCCLGYQLPASSSSTQLFLRPFVYNSWRVCDVTAVLGNAAVFSGSKAAISSTAQPVVSTSSHQGNELTSNQWLFHIAVYLRVLRDKGTGPAAALLLSDWFSLLLFFCPEPPHDFKSYAL